MPSLKELMLGKAMDATTQGVKQGGDVISALRQLHQKGSYDAQEQAGKQAFEKDYRDKDRAQQMDIERMKLEALMNKVRQPSEGQIKREALMNENAVRAEQLKGQYNDTPAWKQIVSRLPFVGGIAGEFDPQIRDLQGNETAITQNETFIKSGAQAPETEYKRMRTSTLPGVFASPAKKAQVLDNALGARHGEGVDGSDLSEEEAAELDQLRKELLGK